METIYSSEIFTDSFQHTGLCAGNKQIKEILTIDDGTGKFFTYELQKDLTWKEYTIVPSFITVPEEPSILDETIISPEILDPYDVVGFSYKDDNHTNNDNDILNDIDPVDYDFYEDGVQNENEENESITQILSIPREQKITQSVRYFTGWFMNTEYITKTIKKTNLPPTACNTLEASCYNVPVEVYTSCSTDQEDNSIDLTINWELYLDMNSYLEITTEEGIEVRNIISDENNRDWVLQGSKHGNPAFSWTYSFEGNYKLIETAVDTDGASDTKERIFDIVFKLCDKVQEEAEQTVQASGMIEVEADVWQLCAIPMTTGIWSKTSHKIIKSEKKSTIKNVIIDQIEDVYGVNSDTLIKVINGYTGDNNEFRNYIPGLTKDSSIHNFQLVFTDDDMDVDDGNTKFEISGFWIKAKDRNFIIKWGVIE